MLIFQTEMISKEITYLRFTYLSLPSCFRFFSKTSEITVFNYLSNHNKIIRIQFFKCRKQLTEKKDYLPSVSKFKLNVYSISLETESKNLNIF